MLLNLEEIEKKTTPTSSSVIIRVCDLPVDMPKERMRMSTEEAKDARAREAAAHRHPTRDTTRHPRIFVAAAARGAETEKFAIRINFSLAITSFDHDAIFNTNCRS